MSQRPVLLQTISLLPSLERQLAETYDVHRLPAAGAERDAFLAARGAEFDGLVTSAANGADAALIAALPKLRAISSFGVGLDKLDLDAAKKRGLPVGYTPDVLNDCVADLAFALMLAIGRRIPEGDRYVRAGRWVERARRRFRSAGRSAAPGSAWWASAASAAPSPSAPAASTWTCGTTAAARWKAWRGSTSRSCWSWRAGPTSWSSSPPAARKRATWSNAEVLDALGTKGYIVNVARGTVIDEAALVKALQEKRIGGAALDVFEREPQVPPELFALDNVVMVPHIASATVQTREAMGQRVLDNLAAGLAGRPMPSDATAG